MKRIKHTVALLRATFRVLYSEPMLLLFPVISGLSLVSLAILIFAPTFVNMPFLRDGLDRYSWWVIREHAAGNPLATLQAFVGLLFVYFCIYGVSSFFNTALVRAALCAMRGEPVTAGDAIRFAFSRGRAVAGYTAIAATIGVLLRALERFGILEKLVARILEFSWGLASTLVIPVLVQERRGGFDSVKRSAQLFRRTWGETLVGGFSLAMFHVLSWLGSAALGFYVARALGLDVLPICVLALLAAQVLSSTLEGIFSAALYTFAAEGVIPGPFDQEMLNDLWTTRGEPQ
jgi:hypothetical protein